VSQIRKLAAILVADIVGYSRLAGADEDRILARLRTLRSDLIDPTIAVHHGRIVKRTGDGIIVEFRSVVDAVRCAIEVQNGLAERNAGLPERRIEFRIGIHLGDVVEEEDGDLMGEGVNIAARLEGVAKPGAICLSEQAYWQVKGRLDLMVTDLGTTRLKNIAEPIRVYLLEVGLPAQPHMDPKNQPHPAPAAKASRILKWWPAVAAALVAVVLAAGAYAWHAGFGSRIVGEVEDKLKTAPRFSIVVLPFANLSGDPGQDYLGDVITEGLTTNLSRIRDSFVIARSTAFTYKGKPIDVKLIGKDLGVRYLLEGSAEQAGSRVRVNAQLIDTTTGAHLWADQFDTDRSDLLRMQDEIITRLARAVEIQLTAADIARAKRVQPDNPDAEELAERCEAGLYNSGSEQTRTDEAFGFCEHALQIDPRNVLALSLLAFKYINPVYNAQSANPQADIRRGDELAFQALTLDPDSYVALLAKAYVLMAQNRAEEGIVEAQRSLALNPSFIDAYIALTEASNFVGRPDRALEYADTATRLSPRDPNLRWFYHDKGWAFFMKGQYDRAIEWLGRAAAISPTQRFTQLLLASALALTGHEAEAHAALQRYLSLAGTNSRTIAQLRAGQLAIANNPVWVEYNERLFDGLRKAGLPEGAEKTN
jgi:adenylate cyclase